MMIAFRDILIFSYLGQSNNLGLSLNLLSRESTCKPDLEAIVLFFNRSDEGVHWIFHPEALPVFIAVRAVEFIGRESTYWTSEC